jgi:GNAT superfamily N-acetyltransferase
VNPDFFSSWSMSIPKPVYPALSHDNLVIRPAMVEDAQSLADVLTYSFHPHSGLRGLVIPLLRLGIYEDLQHRLLNPKPQHVCFVACLSVRGGASMVVGTVEMSVRYVRSRAIAPIKIPYISNLAVDPEYRRLGIARKLLERCDVQIKRWHYDSIVLHVMENNQAAKRLYLQCGYEIQHADQTVSSWLFKQPRRLFLQKNLSH